MHLWSFGWWSCSSNCVISNYTAIEGQRLVFSSLNNSLSKYIALLKQIWMKGGKGGNPQRNHKNKSLEEAAKALPFENLKRKSPKEEKVPCLHIKVDDFVLFFCLVTSSRQFLTLLLHNEKKNQNVCQLYYKALYKLRIFHRFGFKTSVLNMIALFFFIVIIAYTITNRGEALSGLFCPSIRNGSSQISLYTNNHQEKRITFLRTSSKILIIDYLFSQD